MASPVSICNMALSHVGISKEIASIDPPDKNDQARACARFYEEDRDECLRDFPWAFARRIVELALVETLATDGTRDWAYSYRMPSDYLGHARMLNGLGIRPAMETELSRVPFSLASDEDGLLLYADIETPI